MSTINNGVLLSFAVECDVERKNKISERQTNRGNYISA